MIRHIVFFSARDPRDIPAIRDGLAALGTIPGVAHFEVSANRKIDQIANEIDVVVYAEFADDAAFAAYKAHPTYAATTQGVRPLRELRFAADVEAAPRQSATAETPRSLVA